MSTLLSPAAVGRLGRLKNEAIADYAHARASFLRDLGCHNAAIAYGVVRNLKERAT